MRKSRPLCLYLSKSTPATMQWLYALALLSWCSAQVQAKAVFAHFMVLNPLNPPQISQITGLSHTRWAIVPNSQIKNGRTTFN